MRRSLSFVTALLLAGCATIAPTPAPWLAGVWLGLDDTVEFPLACASGLVIRYDPDGRFALFGEEGDWRLEGERLTETTTAFTDASDGFATELNRPYVSRIQREGPDSFLKTYENGEQARFRRCPEE